MKKIDLKNKKEDELKKLLADKRKELSAFKFGISGSRTKDVKAGRTTRREIARILTALHSKADMAE
ncbi:MAG TPA: 50S ribosomal protein L29 [Candidatus Paceibacterota bacterium]|jgi:ribosomal protein L29|nr:50S ribosomal protein L29 [Candidatus Paceibacterota bacterium]HOH11276.1 50S ribosomal protein L29 [Candidatus Paceibacterota bacterium]HOY11231.1 50S ribosomal protein L29 [Candidatus Paceibacterota bacterium]HPB60516.1 50S ribosomal protein L29 [Candidatus Paceibacterota bacterium]HPI24461.1 50S ribosomal protein L29 [Candidatus Paceibacterota bacterium]